MAQQQHDLGSLDDLPLGTMKQVKIDDAKILLIHDADGVHAVSAICPHAGGPLEQGVRRGKRLVCPWHKATFCIDSGKVLEPPALDPLMRYEVEIAGRRIMLTTGGKQSSHDAQPADERCFVIVGAGAAGAVAAQTLREEGFGGRVLMLDAVNRVPYDRTVLSKYALSGETGQEKTPLQTQAFYEQNRIERRTAEVTRIDVAGRHVVCAAGATLNYDAALLATGAVPTKPSLPGVELNGVFLLRSRADADAILVQAERSRRAVILGASFIGMEVAASLRERGLDVTVVGKETAPFAKQLGPRIGAALMTLHRTKGVRFHLGAEMAALEGAEAVQVVRLADGQLVPADMVVVGFGVKPATATIYGLPHEDDGSLKTDSELSVAPGLYAAGDVARFPLYGTGDPVRVEHWRVAQQHGRVAALNMLGRHVRYDAPPVFWTIHYLKRLDYIGHAEAWDDIVVHGDLGKPEFLAYYVGHGRVLAAAGMDRDQDTAALVELLTLRQDWTADELGSQPSRILAAHDGL